jgi:hypothetical protein
MSGYTKFDSEIYSEELHAVTESEYDEVMADDWQGYPEWSSEVEADAWRGSKQVGQLLIKKACEHPACGHFKCERDLRIGGIAI